LRRLTGRLPGAQGLQQLIELTAGLDIADPDALHDAGLRDDAPVLAFRWHDAVWLAIPVRSEAGARHVLKLLEQRGYAATSSQPGSWRIADRSQRDADAGHAWLRDDTLLLRAGADPEQALATYLAAPRLTGTDLGQRQGGVHVHALVDKPTLAALHDAVGPANLLIGGAIDKIERADVDVALAPNPSVGVRLSSAPGALADIAAYHSGFLPAVPGTQSNLGNLLPNETPLLLQARLNPAMLAMLPATVRDQLLPATLLDRLHPALAGVDARLQLLDVLDGQLAFALLGIADTVPIDPHAWSQLSWRTALRVAIAGSLRTDTDATALLQRVRSALELTPEKPRTVQLGDWSGMLVPGPEAPWMLLQHGRQVAMVSGAGEPEDLAHTASGKFPSLTQAARGTLEQSIVRGPSPWLSGLATTPRLVRSLRRRGMPDYVVQMLDSIAAVSVGVVLEPSAIRLDMQLRPAHDEAP
jgi:hypothetical protein